MDGSMDESVSERCMYVTPIRLDLLLVIPAGRVPTDEIISWRIERGSGLN